MIKVFNTNMHEKFFGELGTTGVNLCSIYRRNSRSPNVMTEEEWCDHSTS